MKELQVGFAMITTEEYKRMYLRAQELEDIINEYQRDEYELKERMSVFEEYFLDNIYQENKWKIEKLEVVNEKLNKDDYRYKDLIEKFIKAGVKDIDYIETKIVAFYERYLKEKKGEENE